MNILSPDKSYIDIYGKEPWYNRLQYNDNPDIKMIF